VQCCHKCRCYLSALEWGHLRWDESFPHKLLWGIVRQATNEMITRIASQEAICNWQGTITRSTVERQDSKAGWTRAQKACKCWAVYHHWCGITASTIHEVCT
jgi:hypothetical protein